MNIQELKRIGIKKLTENNVDEAAMKVSILLQFVLRMNKTELLLKDTMPVSQAEEESFFNYVEEIIEGKPIQYITNHQEFMGLNFYVDENVLIPQPDTEILVEQAIAQIEKNKMNCKYVKVLDLCTGSGAVAIAIAHYFIKKQENCKIKIYASDVSEKALKIAKRNAKQILADFYAKKNKLDLKSNLKAVTEEKIKNVEIQFINSNMFENIEGKFDLIVSNPPYIETDAILQLSKEVQNEPHIALDGGVDGLDFYRIIAKDGRNYLKKHGSILVEIGYTQKESVSKIFAGYNKLECFKDLTGNDRVIIAELENFINFQKLLVK